MILICQIWNLVMSHHSNEVNCGIHSGLFRMHSIYNHSQRPTIEDQTQINGIMRSLFSTHIISGGCISSTFKKLLQEFYRKHTVQFLAKWYTEPRIYHIHNVWVQYEAACMKFTRFLIGAIAKADVSHVIKHDESTIDMAQIRCDLINVYVKQENKSMNRINESTQMLIANGYIRHNAGNLDIPEC
eukprot:841915_1